MNILIADDHPLYREALATVLDDLEPGVRVHQAATFDEVIARVLDPSLTFDLILLDLYMGAGDWNAVIEKVRVCCPQTPVIVISASASRADSERAMRAGAYGYIPKAMKTDEMLSAIRLIVTGGVCIQPRDTGAEPDRSGISITCQCQKDIDSRLSLLTARQRDVLVEIGTGKSNKLIARSLGMTEGTVKLHVAAILKCLGMANRTQAAVVAHQLGSNGAQAGSG
jgi:DNA-binding NarL/FixJ family response regulator